MFHLNKLKKISGKKLFKFCHWCWFLNQILYSRISKYDYIELFFMAEHDSEKELEFLAYLDFLKALRDEKVFNLRIIDDHDKIFDYSKGHTITLAVPIEERYKFHVNLKIGYYIYKGNLADIDDIQLDWFCRKLTKISRFLNEGM